MDTSETPTENAEPKEAEKVDAGEMDMAKIEAMVTPEQVLSANVAKRRRTITRKRSTSLSKARSQTPMRASALDASSSSDDGANETHPKTPERRQRRITRTVSNNVKLLPDTETPTTKDDTAKIDASAAIKDVKKRSSSQVKTVKKIRPKTVIDDGSNDTKERAKLTDVKPEKQPKPKIVAEKENIASNGTNEVKPISDIDPENKLKPKTVTNGEDNDKGSKAEGNDESPQQSIQPKPERRTRPKKPNDSANNSARHSIISDTSSNLERSSSLPRQFEEQMVKLDNFVSTNKKDIMNLLHKAKTSVEEKGKELRRRKFNKTEQKRSQSTPKQLTEGDVLESFRIAQEATAEREKERIRSSSARRYSSGSEKSEPEPTRPARKPAKSSVQELIKQKKAQRQLRSTVKSNKIIEILDPKTSKVISVKDVGQVTRIQFLDVFKIFRYYSLRQIIREYSKYKTDMHHEYKMITKQKRRCINHLLILMIFVGLGGIVFKFTEGSFENFYKCGVKRVKRDFIDLLWMKSHNLREEEWKSLARNRLRMFEDELHNAHEAGIHSYSGQKSWSFLNGIVYCLTVVTTIGYGHLYPTTKTGQALTILYSLIGIPLFLIILTDFGKLFTRCIKFLWSFVRRLYYTGSCRSVRKTAQVQEIFKGAQMMYEFATFRRQSMFDPNMNTNAGETSAEANTTAPPTPAISNFEIDDEFNLPISVAILLLVFYILFGAFLFGFYENWDFFTSFYFVFISMSTIGFGDYVPRHPVVVVVSIVYLVFGLALMSMCINVVQVKLSDTFNQASAKIGATIGLGVAEEDGTIKPLPPKTVEMPQVHGSIADVHLVKDDKNVPDTSTKPTFV